MSIEAVKDFYEKIASDEKFQNKLNELQDKATEGLKLPLTQDKKEEMIKDVIIPFAKEQGFNFSIKDIKEFEKSIVEQLDEEQLESIAAGGGFGSPPCGIGGTICKIVGLGFGGVAGYNGIPTLCIILGFGDEIGICGFFGTTI